MDKLQFTSEIVDSIAWPACVLGIVLLYRDQISTLLKRVVKGKFPGGEFEFSELAKEKLQTADVEIATEAHSVDAPDESSRLDIAYELLDRMPRAAVIEGWQQLEAVALDRLDKCEDGSDYSSAHARGRLPSSRIGDLLKRHRVLPSDQIVLFDELRRLRNQTLHDINYDPDEKTAKEFLVLAELLMGRIESCSPDDVNGR